MSAGSLPGSGGSGSQDFELNLASIIDCFTVLIAFMLASASFLSIGILDAGIAAAGTEASSKKAPPPISIEVELRKDRAIGLKVSGRTTQSSTFAPAAGGAWNLEELSRQLASLRARFPEAEALMLSADEGVEYSDVILAMDAARKSVPAILLGGF
jgi:biopolymer transport protein ExbD